MKVEAVQWVVVAVDDLDEGCKFYGTLFNTSFKRIEASAKDGWIKWAISPFGLELYQRLKKVDSSEDSLRSFHLRVDHLPSAVKEMKDKGFEPIEEWSMDELREAIYQIRGLRIVLIDYKRGPSS